jgi:hypothetical protein
MSVSIEIYMFLFLVKINPSSRFGLVWPYAFPYFLDFVSRIFSSTTFLSSILYLIKLELVKATAIQPAHRLIVVGTNNRKVRTQNAPNIYGLINVKHFHKVLCMHAPLNSCRLELL